MEFLREKKEDKRTVPSRIFKGCSQKKKGSQSGKPEDTSQGAAGGGEP